MSERLRDGTGSPGSGEARAARLLRAARPKAHDHGAYLRVRSALASASGAPRATWGARLRVGGAIAAAVFALAAAALLARHGWRRAERSPAPVAIVASSPPASSPPASSPPTPSPPAPAPSAFAAPSPSLRLAPPRPTARRAHVALQPSRVDEPGAVASSLALARVPSLAAAAESPQVAIVVAADVDPIEAQLLSDAVTALRRDGDAARALTLVDYYRRRFAAGALVEEALALAVEAEAARHGQVAARAAAYRRRYPAGRYRATVDGLDVVGAPR